MKRKLCLGLALLCCAGCAGKPAEAAGKPQEVDYGDLVAEYAESVSDDAGFKNGILAVTRGYKLESEDRILAVYNMDGTLQMEDGKGLFQQNIDSDGMQSVLSGWYEDGRLFNTYNGVQYYEDMSAEQLQSSLLYPLSSVVVQGAQIQDLKKDGSTWTISLTTDAARFLLLSHYDIFDLSSYDDVQVQEGTITQTVDNGQVVREQFAFTASLSSNGMPIQVCATGSREVSSLRDALSAPDGFDPDAYVYYQDIDTEAISDADLSEDAPGATAYETFEKRLVSRLDYKKVSDGVYRTEFNDNESYVVDLNLDQFTYTNRSSAYVYNWSGDTGGFGSSCSYSFANGSSTDGCDETVLDMIKMTKDSLRMELYFCGLSLDDLIKEKR